MPIDGCGFSCTFSVNEGLIDIFFLIEGLNFLGDDRNHDDSSSHDWNNCPTNNFPRLSIKVWINEASILFDRSHCSSVENLSQLTMFILDVIMVANFWIFGVSPSSFVVFYQLWAYTKFRLIMIRISCWWGHTTMIIHGRSNGFNHFAIFMIYFNRCIKFIRCRWHLFLFWWIVWCIRVFLCDLLCLIVFCNCSVTIIPTFL